MVSKSSKSIRRMKSTVLCILLSTVITLVERHNWANWIPRHGFSPIFLPFAPNLMEKPALVAISMDHICFFNSLLMKPKLASCIVCFSFQERTCFLRLLAWMLYRTITEQIPQDFTILMFRLLCCCSLQVTMVKTR